MKATSGGTFDHDQHGLYFIAGAPVAVADVPHRNVLVAVNEVNGAKQRDYLDRMLDEGRRVLLDSGIFNLAMSHAKAHDLSMDTALTVPPEEVDGFPDLRDAYYDLATTYQDRLWGIVELDQGGAAVKPITRATIEKDTGIIPMPVYHPMLDGWDYYDTLAQQYDRLCFGNIVKASPPMRLRLVHTAYERARAYPHLFTHLLGLTPNENTLALAMRGSFDSSSWLKGVRWMPSWMGWSMLKMVAHYPPDMWYRAGVDSYGQARGMGGASAHFTQATIDAVRQDTHA